MTREDRMLRVSLCCLSAACVLALIGWVGPEKVAAGGLVLVAVVGVTVCLAMMADGRVR